MWTRSRNDLFGLPGRRCNRGWQVAPSARSEMMRTNRQRAGWGVGSAAAILLMASSVAAQAQDSEQGRLLARQWCTSCHLVEAGGTASDAAPPFATISKDPANTPERLHGWLAAPHPPMPDLKLSRDEEDDIVAYLLSLKPR